MVGRVCVIFRYNCLVKVVVIIGSSAPAHVNMNFFACTIWCISVSHSHVARYGKKYRTFVINFIGNGCKKFRIITFHLIYRIIPKCPGKVIFIKWSTCCRDTKISFIQNTNITHQSRYLILLIRFNTSIYDIRHHVPVKWSVHYCGQSLLIPYVCKYAAAKLWMQVISHNLGNRCLGAPG